MNTSTTFVPPANETAWQRADWRNLLLIVAGFGIAVLLMPINHNFANVDDWIYASAVRHILAGDGFMPPDLSQVTLVTHAWLGAAFAWLYGLNFTSLTAATITMSLVTALSFYSILRRLGFSAGLSGLGTAALALNPQYVNLSYSYMTDLTFLALLLLGCRCYLEGLPEAEGWLWLGSLCAALAFLTRQFGLVLPLAALIWLLFAHQLTLRRLLAVALMPALVSIAYFIWRSGFPPTVADSFQRQLVAALLHDPALEFSNRILTMLLSLPLLGLTIPLFSRVQRWWLLGLWAVALGGVACLFNQQSAASPASLRGAIGASPPGLATSPLWWMGVLLAAWLLTIVSERSWAWLQQLQPRRTPRSADFFYLVALLLLVGTFVATRVIYLRYLLPLLPFLIAVTLRPLQSWSRRKLLVIVAALTLVGIYSAVAHLDDFDINNTRWQAGIYLLNSGVPAEKIDNGYAWDGYYLYDEAVKRLNIHSMDLDLGNYPPYLLLDPQYIVAMHPQPGYRVLKQFSFLNRWNSFRTYTLLVQQRTSP